MEKQWHSLTVSDDGTIRKGDRAVIPTETNGYKIIRCIGSNHYVHRIVAELFVDNPDRKSLVTFKDGNSLNVAADNLIWVTHTELRQLEFTRGRYEIITCQSCGKQFYNRVRKRDNRTLCCICEKQARLSELSEIRQKKDFEYRKSYYTEIFRDIDIGSLRPAMRQIAELLLAGNNQAEVARKLGVSRQYINSSIKMICECNE